MNKIVLAGILFLCLNSNAQIQNYTIKKITIEDGLSQSSNLSRFEDSKGFMWLSTYNAINRFDGCNIKIYNNISDFDSASILRNSLGHVEDKNSNIYFGSGNGIFKYIRNQDKFFLVSKIKKYSESAYPIALIKDELWFFNSNLNLFKYNVVTESVIQVSFIAYNRKNYILDLTGSSSCFPLADNNNLWFLLDGQLIRFNTTNNQIDYPLKNFIKKSIQCFTFNKLNLSIYFSTGEENHIWKVNSSRIKTVKNKYYLKGYLVIDIKCSKNFCCWTDAFNTIAVADLDLKDSFFIEKNKDNIFSFNALSFDKSERLWVCDNGKGLLIFNFNKPFINLFNHNLLEPQKPISFGGVFQDKNSQIYVSSASGLNRLNLNTKTQEALDLIKDYTSESFVVYNKFLCKDFYIRINEINGKHVIFEKSKGNLFEKKLEIFLFKGLGKPSHQIFIDSFNLMMCYAQEIILLNIKTKKFNKIEYPKGRPYYLNRINDTLLAISIRGNGLWLTSINKGNIKFLKNILPKKECFYIEYDNNSQCYWVGGLLGIHKLNKKFETIKYFTTQDGLAGEIIYGLLIGNDNNVWVSHQKGISCLMTKDNKIINFTPKDGLQDWDFNDRCFLKASDGTLFFGGISGLNYFKPPYLPIDFYKKKLYIGGIYINNKSYDFKLIEGEESIIPIKEGQNSIKFNVFIQDLDMNSNNEFYYKIEDNWQKSSGSILELANIVYGKTKIEFGVLNNVNGSIVSVKSILLNKPKPFYKTIWFWIFFFLLLIIVFVYLLYVNIITKQNAELNKHKELENQRSMLTADLHDDIGANLSTLLINSNIANNLIEKQPEKARIFITKIEEQSKELADKIGDFVWSLKSNENNFMNFSERIKNYASETIGSAEINYQISIDFNVDLLIKNIFQKKNLMLLTKEAINNSFKYSKAQNIILEISVHESIVYYRFKDDGIGFDSSNVVGNGIGNMKNRAKELGGEFRLISSKNNGCKIEFEFKLIP